MWKDHDPPDGIGIDFDNLSAPPPVTIGEVIGGIWCMFVTTPIEFIFTEIIPKYIPTLIIGSYLSWCAIWYTAAGEWVTPAQFYRLVVHGERHDRPAVKPTSVFDEQEQPDEQTHRRPQP